MYILKGILYFPWRPTNICVVKISPTKILLSNVHLGRMQVSWRLDNDCSFLVLAITAGPGKIHYHRKDNYDFRAVSLFGVLFKRSVSQHSFIYPPPSTGGWIDVTLATLYSYTHLTYIHVRPYLNMCLYLQCIPVHLWTKACPWNPRLLNKMEGEHSWSSAGENRSPLDHLRWR